jgi:hypothetical protein
MRTKIMEGTSAVLTADKESDSAMGADHGREANHDSGGGRGPHTAAAARDLPTCHRHPLRRAALLLWRRRPHRGYKTFDGLAFPTRRRVYRRNGDGTPDRILAAITLDIDDITTA